MSIPATSALASRSVSSSSSVGSQASSSNSSGSEDRPRIFYSRDMLFALRPQFNTPPGTLDPNDHYSFKSTDNQPGTSNKKRSAVKPFGFNQHPTHQYDLEQATRRLEITT